MSEFFFPPPFSKINDLNRVGEGAGENGSLFLIGMLLKEASTCDRQMKAGINADLQKPVCWSRSCRKSQILSQLC